MNYQNPRPYNDSAGNQVVTVAQIGAHLRVDTTDENQWFQDAIDAATEAAESALNASLLRRTIVATFYDNAPMRFAQHGKLSLPQGPVASITSVVDVNSQVITNYQLAGEGTADFLRMYHSYVAPLTVTYVAGYGTLIANIPADIRMAIRTHVASMWRNRESISELKMAPLPHSLEMFYSNKKRSLPIA